LQFQQVIQFMRLINTSRIIKRKRMENSLAGLYEHWKAMGERLGGREEGISVSWQCMIVTSHLLSQPSNCLLCSLALALIWIELVDTSWMVLAKTLFN